MKLKNSILAGLAALALSCSSYALSIYDVNANLGNGGPIVGGNTPDTDYKFDVPGTESGAVDMFETVISNGGKTATVTWSPTGSVSVDDIYLKAANSYIYWDTSGVDWSTYDGFSVTNTLIVNSGNGSVQNISHISVNGSGESVPDNGLTLAFLGLGMVMIGSFHRFLRR